MIPANQAALVGTVASLLEEAITRQHAPAMVRDQLHNAAPDRTIELIQEELGMTNGFDYQAIVPLEDGAAIGVSVSLPNALPWPLRGVRRWSERDVLRVNNTTLQVADVIQSLDGHLRVGDLAQHLVDGCLIREAIHAHPIEVTPEMRQQALDRFRRSRGLHTAYETRQWMSQRGYTQSMLEEIAAAEAEVRALRHLVVGDAVELFFETHRAELALIEIMRITCETRVSLADAWAACERSSTAFLAWLHRVRGVVSSARLRKWDLDEVLGRSAPTQASPSLLGPIEKRGGSQFIQILSVAAAAWNPQTREDVELLLFHRWLAERRRQSRVTWFWGERDQGEREGTA